MAITALENNFAIAPLVLWSRQLCPCAGTLSHWSVLFQVSSSLSRLGGSLGAPALDSSGQTLHFSLLKPFSFLSALHHVLAHYRRPRTLVRGICSAPSRLCCPAGTWGAVPGNGSRFAPSVKHLPVPPDTPRLTQNIPERDIFLLQ